MRLLPPKELNTKLNEQKKSAIDAGVFIAKKVDALREELADTQAQHEIFMQNIKEEQARVLGELSTKKSLLDTEIAYLEAKREELLVPLDAEWKKVNELIQKNSDEAWLNKQKEHELADREANIARKEKQTEADKIRAQDSLSKAQEKERKAIEVLEANKQELINMENARFAYEDDKKKLLFSIEEKLRKLTYDIKHYNDFEKHLREKEAELNLREKRLAIRERK